MKRKEPILSPPLVYRLVFHSGRLSAFGGGPRVRCVVPNVYAQHVDKMLFVEPQRGFSVPHTMFGLFGYKECGQRTQSAGEVVYDVRYLAGSLDAVVSTALALFSVLNDVFHLRCGGFFVGGERKDRQYMTIEMSHYDGSGLGRYDISGFVYQKMKCCLTAISSSVQEPKSSYSRETFQGTTVSELDEVVDALEEAHLALVAPDLKREVDACYAGVSLDGRFSLSCFGNSCDVSIYPDAMGHRDGTIRKVAYPVRFGCHNMDGPAQQLILLAGLAALYDTAWRASHRGS